MRNENPDPPDSMGGTIELHLEFAGTRLTVRTRDRQIAERLRESYAFMLLADETAHVGGKGQQSDNAIVVDLVADLPIGLELLQFIHNEISSRFIAARQDLLWVHAGAVERHGRALLVAGESGQGKSTLTTMLCDEGWNYMSDDVAPIDMVTDTVLPFPQTPRRRVYSERHLTSDEVQTLDRRVVSIARETVRFEPAVIGCVVFLDFRRGAGGRMEPLAAGEFAMAILGSATNFPDHRNAAVERAAALAKRIPAYRLVYDDPAAAIRAIAAIVKD